MDHFQFMPHGMCYLWRPDLLALHVISDGLITVAYFSIPFTLLYFVKQRRDLEFNWMFVCFAVFIQHVPRIPAGARSKAWRPPAASRSPPRGDADRPASAPD